MKLTKHMDCVVASLAITFLLAQCLFVDLRQKQHLEIMQVALFFV